MEQHWRARLFLMAWVLSHNEAYAWSIALADDPDGEARHVEGSIDDEAILSGLRSDRDPIRE